MPALQVFNKLIFQTDSLLTNESLMTLNQSAGQPTIQFNPSMKSRKNTGEEQN